MTRTKLIGLFVGQGTSLAGSQATAFAFSVIVLRQSGLVVWSIILFAGYLMGAVGSFAAGPAIRRHGPRTLMIAGCVGGAVASSALLILTAANSFEVWMLICTNSLLGACTGLQQPAYLQLLYEEAVEGKAARLQAIAQTVGAVALVAGPALGAVFYELLGVESVLVFDVATFGMLGCVLVTLPRGAPAVALGNTAKPQYRSLLAHRSFVVLISVFTLSGLFLGVRQSLRPAIVLGSPVGGTTVLATVLVVGALAAIPGGILYSVFATRWPTRVVLLISFIGTGIVGQAFFGLFSGVVAWSISSAAVGAFSPIMVAAAYTMLFEKLPTELRSHGIAFARGCAALSLPVAVLASGPAASAVASLSDVSVLSAADYIMVATGCATAVLGLIFVLQGGNDGFTFRLHTSTSMSD